MLDPDRRREAVITPGIGGRLYVKDLAGRITHTVEPGPAGQMIIKDQHGRRIGTVER